MMFCPKCGTQNTDGTKFCSTCGGLLQQPASAAGVSAGTAGEEQLLQSLIGKNADYYMQKRSEMAQKGTKISWNWAAFLFTFWWLIYRKVYRLGVVLFAVNLVFTLTLPLPVTTIAIPLFTGLMGNYLYIQYVNNCYAEAAAMDTVSRDAYAAKHCGTIF